MKVAVVFQFYLPYVLPRAKDWDDRGVSFRADDFRARVRPRRTDEDLFPEDIDKTLSSMTLMLARLSLPQSATTTTVRDLCHDRLEVVVEGDVPSLDEARKPGVHDQCELRAIQAGNLFLDHCRVVSRSPFVLGVQRHFRLQDQKFYVLTPRTIAWFDGESGDRLPVFEGGVNAQAASGAIPSPERGGATMDAIQASISRGSLPDLAESLLLDAEAALVTLRIRETLLELCTACEVASDQYIERKNGLQNQRVRDALDRRGLSFVARRYDLIPTILSGRSMATEAPEAFADVERAYRARNTVAHEGRPSYEESGREIQVNPAVAMQFLGAARRAIEWLSAL